MNERVSDYDYDVPPEAVAQVPAARRDGARLLVVPRAERTGVPRAGDAVPDLAAAGQPELADRHIGDLPGLLRAGDLLVLNATRVLPAKLTARRVPSGGRVSVLVLEPRGREATVLLGARGTLAPGEHLAVAGDTWRLERALGEGRFDIVVAQGRDVRTLLADAGRMPLPPYIDRDPEADTRDGLDRERYQTVFAETGVLPTPSDASVTGDAGATGDADTPGAAGAPGVAGAAVAAGAAGAAGAARAPGDAIAAPTAGLHFTPELLAAVAARGVRVERLRLDVGEGTFRPLRGETLDEHVMHSEAYEIPAALAAAFADTRAAGGRIVAVGTTVVRALESAVTPDGRALRPGATRTSVFLRPGHEFRAVDALLTNFHQPRSTLLVLVSAFAGRETIRAAYAHALAHSYRFFSYGDAMLLA